MALNNAIGSSNVDPKRATPLVYLYLGLLMLFVLSPGNLFNTPLQFIYSDRLHLDPPHVAIFKSIINAPGYVAFLFGITRDRFNPLRMGDRGFIFIFASVAAAIFVAIAKIPLTPVSLAVCLILWGIATGLVNASFQAMMRNIADMRRMSGRMSTTYQLMGGVIGMVFLACGGWLSDHFSWMAFLYLTAGCYFALGLFGLWKPEEVFDGLPSGGMRTLAHMRDDLMLLFRYRAFWLAVLIWGIWAFAPAGPTPLFFFLKDHLKMGRTEYGYFNALMSGAGVPTIILFGFLCKKMSLWRLLILSTCIGIPQWLPVMFIHSANQAYVVSAIMGLAGGLATAAYYGLLFRACPEGLAGTGMLFAGSLALIVTEGGNILGGIIYKAWGFQGCALLTTGAYVLLLPLCYLLPRALVEPKDDQRVPTEQELVA